MRIAITRKAERIVKAQRGDSSPRIACAIGEKAKVGEWHHWETLFKRATSLENQWIERAFAPLPLVMLVGAPAFLASAVTFTAAMDESWSMVIAGVPWVIRASASSMRLSLLVLYQSLPYVI